MKRILIIDDEEDLCMLMKSYFAPFHYDIHMAFTLKEGLKKADEIAPDVLFLDNNLPDGLGWEAVHTLQKKLPRCHINLMSAFTHPSKELQELPQVKFLEKPISLSALKKIID